MVSLRCVMVRRGRCSTVSEDHEVDVELLDGQLPPGQAARHRRRQPKCTGRRAGRAHHFQLHRGRRDGRV